MQTIHYTEEYLRRRRFYLFLPLLALPFLTFIYWVLVVKNLKSSENIAGGTGLQLSLPNASLKDEQAMDKWQYYRKADQDSALRIQQIKRDPYRRDGLIAPTDTLYSKLRGLEAPGGKRKKAIISVIQPAGSKTWPEEEVHKKLQNLEKALTSTQSPSFERSRPIVDKDKGREDQPEIARLEALLKSTESENHVEEVDPELVQLNGMLDKILEIQNPGINSPLSPHEQTATQTPALPVYASDAGNPITILSGDRPADSLEKVNPVAIVGFFGLEDDQAEPAETGITAVIEKTQRLVSGSTVQLRLTRAINVSGQTMSQNAFIYGMASLSGERLKIKISTIRTNEEILPVNLMVYDLDGIEGIYIPGTISRSVTKQALGSQVQGVDLDVGGFSLGAQAANAGMQLGRTLMGRKTRLTQVTLQEDYKVILRDASSTQPQIQSGHEK